MNWKTTITSLTLVLALCVTQVVAVAETVEVTSSPTVSATPAPSATPTPAPVALGLSKVVTSTPITSGATHKTYKYTFKRSSGVGTAIIQVIEVDLTNPYVKLDLMTGKNGQLTKRSSVLQMTKDTKAVAGLNADFFNMSTSKGFTAFGGSIQNSQLITTPNNTRAAAGWYTFGVTKDKKPLIDVYTFSSKLKTPDGTVQSVYSVNKEGAPYVSANGVATHTYQNRVMMFTPAWGRELRGYVDGLTPSEILVENGIVKQISMQAQIPGLVPKNAVILSVDGTLVDKLLGGDAPKLKVGDAVVLETTFTPKNPENPKTVDGFSLMVGGHSILVDGGVAATIPEEMFKGASGAYERSRSAIGYNKDNTTVYMVGINKNDSSAGISLTELKKVMIALGCEKAMNLDGGGSTTVVTRPLGTTTPTLASQVEFSSMRQVMNGIGVYSTAPKGALAGIQMQGPKTVLIGEASTYSLTGYDTYYNPVTVSVLKPVWTFDATFGKVSGSTFTPTKSGTMKVEVKSGSLTQTTSVKVLAGKELKKLEIDTTAKSLQTGSRETLAVYATSADGVRRKVPLAGLKWSFIGMKAHMSGSTLVVDDMYKVTTAGKIVAIYDGVSTSLSIPVPNEWSGAGMVWENFNGKLGFSVAPQYLPSTVKGKVGVVNGALQFDYDFTEATNTTVLYAKLNGDKGVKAPGMPIRMQIGVLGDKSYNSIRMEVLDGKGVLHKVEIARAVDWVGWKTLNVELINGDQQSPNYGKRIVGPVTLKRVYVFDWGDNRLGLEPNEVGTIALDDMSWISSTSPAVVDGVTFVPVAPSLGGFGGTLTWDVTKKVATVKKGTKSLVFTLGVKSAKLNGVPKVIDAAPYMNGTQLMVPLGAMTGLLGLKASWNGVDATIVLK